MGEPCNEVNCTVFLKDSVIQHTVYLNCGKINVQWQNT